jgi:glucosamine--fructose-6-phosphate aminotransferase (isomerizing)
VNAPIDGPIDAPVAVPAPESTLMHSEAAQAADVVAAQFRRNADAVAALAAELRASPPAFIATCARGSSDHAATYAKYLFETQLGVVTASLSPSVHSVYAARPNLRGALFVAISQSGKSPDLLAAAGNARERGALVVALCNTPDAPLMQVAHHGIALHAGRETSVAATKSFIASLSALVHLVAEWTQSRELSAALAAAPVQLREAWAADWRAGVEPLTKAHNLFVIGRGYGLGIAQEAALKLKETCGLHAEAFSAAEVQHGPMALVGRGFPILAFSQNDDSRDSIEAMAREFVSRAATVLLAGGRVDGARGLPVVAAHPVIEPMLMIQSFYRLAESVARARGLDPDTPPHLRKVTETV